LLRVIPPLFDKGRKVYSLAKSKKMFSIPPKYFIFLPTELYNQEIISSPFS